MEKRTLLAVVLSVVVLTIFYVIQGQINPKPPVTPGAPVSRQEAVEKAAEIPAVELQSPVDTRASNVEPGEEALSEERLTVETDLLVVNFTNAGGDIVSYKLKEHKDRDDLVEMIFAGEKEAHAFTVAFGGINAPPVENFFHVNRISPHSVEFYRDFSVPAANMPATNMSAVNGGGENGKFRLTKRYDFLPDEYMFQLTVTLDGGYSLPSLNFSGAAYTLAFGPQIGPRFEKLDRRDEYRRYLTMADKKRKEEKVGNNSVTNVDSRVTWAAITGKYFTLVALPDASPYETAFSTVDEPGVPSASRLFFTRPAINTSKTVDTFRFYLGPKDQKNLGIYDNATSAYKIRDLQISGVASTSGILAPLEWLLKQLLQIFYKLIPNYGIAIMLLTLFSKVVLFPLTKKSSESTLRMQALSPKIQELQAKYKDNPAKMNAEMSELYKKEGYNPLSGCLPLLIQFPIILAMYNLFNSHFDLRGAVFIPGWIPDLSRPEYIFSFAPFRLPILGWSEIRALPFIYLLSQLLYGKVTQTPDQKTNSQMKMMLFFMPIMFFFILYNVPSGLLIYWTLSNVLTLVQQLTINKYLAKRKAVPAASPQPVIAPRSKKKKK